MRICIRTRLYVAHVYKRVCLFGSRDHPSHTTQPTHPKQTALHKTYVPHACTGAHVEERHTFVCGSYCLCGCVCGALIMMLMRELVKGVGVGFGFHVEQQKQQQQQGRSHMTHKRFVACVACVRKEISSNHRANVKGPDDDVIRSVCSSRRRHASSPD